MKYEIEKVFDALAKYIDSELYPRMNDFQEFAARVLVGRVLENKDEIKDSLVNNGYIRTFGIIDYDGMVDVEGLASDIKREISRKGKITFSVPMFGKMTFVPSDVDIIHQLIVGGGN
jgi:hypothetical protein